MARWLIACEYSGRAREAFRARGHDVISCDLLPSEDNSPHHIVGDVFDVIAKEGPFDAMLAHPPCVYLTNSGVRWLETEVVMGRLIRKNEERWAKMLESAQFFADLMNCDIPKVACENPVMHGWGRHEIEKLLGRPLNTKFVQPHWFGDEAFKATGFTLKGLPPLEKPDDALIPPKPGTLEHKKWSVIHQASPGPNRWKERSRTFPGIARAMAETWS